MRNNKKKGIGLYLRSTTMVEDTGTASATGLEARHRYTPVSAGDASLTTRCALPMPVASAPWVMLLQYTHGYTST